MPCQEKKKSFEKSCTYFAQIEYVDGRLRLLRQGEPPLLLLLLLL